MWVCLLLIAREDSKFSGELGGLPLRRVFLCTRATGPLHGWGGRTGGELNGGVLLESGGSWGYGVNKIGKNLGFSGWGGSFGVPAKEQMG